MARQLRIEYEGAFYHVTSRGNQRGKIFWDDKDRKKLKAIIERTKERYLFGIGEIYSSESGEGQGGEKARRVQVEELSRLH